MSGLKMFLQVFTTASLFLGILREVATVVLPIVVTPDVDSMTCAGAIAIPNSRVCPGRSVMFECTTNETGVLVWRTSTVVGSISFASINGDVVGAMETLDGFTATLTAVEMDILLTSTLTVTASDEVSGAEVTCLDSITLSANSRSVDMPPFVEASPSPPQMVNAVSDSLDCGAGVENFIVSWQCPADTSGSAVTDFTVSVDGGNPQMIVGTAEMSDPIPVALNEEHTFSVVASNCFGTGLPNSILLTRQAPAPSTPVMLAASLNCQSTLDTITVTWTEPDTDLRCPVTSRTVSAVNSRDSSDSLSCTNTQSPSICSGSIAGATYDVTVAVASDLSVSQSNPSTQSFQVTVQRFIVDTTLLPNSNIEVTLEERCEEDPTRYGVAVIHDTGSSPIITRFLTNPILVTVNAGQPFSVRLYYDNTVLEETEELTAGCSRVGLTANNVVINPDQNSYENGAVITFACMSGTFSGPERRTCVMGLWDPPLSDEAACTASSVPIWIVAPIVIGVLLLLATGGVGGICIYKRKTKRYSPSDSQQPGPLYEDMSSHEKSKDIALEGNVAYGPVTPQQPAAMYEELSAQPEKIEISGNVAYGQISQ